MTTVRLADHQDALFLWDMLAIASSWRPGTPSLSAERIMSRKDVSHYVAGWPRAGDVGFIAEEHVPIGAAWWRFFSEDDRGYGFVSAAIPEIAIGVSAGNRGTGIGTWLLKLLIAEAQSLSLPALSLSVEPDNYAAAIYRKLGFVPVDTVGDSLTMLLTLSL